MGKPTTPEGKIARPNSALLCNAFSLSGVKNSGPSASLRRLHDAPHRAARHAWPSEPEFFIK